jgi:hypothetical protein
MNMATTTASTVAKVLPSVSTFSLYPTGVAGFT